MQSIQSAAFAAMLVCLCVAASAADAPLGDMTPFKKIASDTQALVDKNDLKGAKTRIKDLETTWDNAEGALKGPNPAVWSAVDKAIDQALKDVRAAHPVAATCSKSLKSLIEKFDAVQKK